MAAWAQSGQKIVPVLWQYADRKVVFTIPQSYIEVLKKCGITPNISPRPDRFPVDKLFCPGILNDSASAELMARATRMVDRLIEGGLKQIADVNLAELRAQMTTVRLRVSEHALFESVLDAPGTPRRFAVNIEELRLAILNGPYWKLQKDSEFADAFLIHEILGALGHRDEQYQATLTMWWLSRHPERIAPLSKELPGFLVQMPRQDFSTISIVGHGGDSNQIAFKASLLAITEKPMAIDVPAKFIPSREKIEALILTAPTSSASTKFMMEHNICDASSIYTCGGFTIKGATGKPFLLISDEWGGLGDPAKQAPLLEKIYAEMVRGLVCASGYRCPNGASR